MRAFILIPLMHWQFWCQSEFCRLMTAKFFPMAKFVQGALVVGLMQQQHARRKELRHVVNLQLNWNKTHVHHLAKHGIKPGLSRDIRAMHFILKSSRVANVFPFFKKMWNWVGGSLVYQGNVLMQCVLVPHVRHTVWLLREKG